MIGKWAEDFGVESPGSLSWSHGTNSEEALIKALEGTVHFIETDVMINRKAELVCAHPPNTDSDLTLNAFFWWVRGKKTMKKAFIGIKLDFKLPEILWSSLGLLEKYKFKTPVILNADILRGNGAEPARFHPEAFLVICQTYLRYHPNTIVSPGWTTAEGMPYTKENVDEMISVCRWLDNVTFPVRLSLMEESWPQLQRLIEKDGWTLTVWSGTDPVTDQQRQWLRDNVDHNKAFIDIG
ncbi:MAG TPA: DUF2181 domain-containing protein [Candidatus Paceibacterota bacterium]|nr:DUF2181 domain-containing protein [Candidatus Pacearchaeota archaeon]HRZ51446.1 DUF2181 domain-containing protein [Candidatus Paceibacterota bacterium]HSA37153.1 DUF2181 domain-containing protein [Candidatus Paceibacterota bacterium]